MTGFSDFEAGMFLAAEAGALRLCCCFICPGSGMRRPCCNKLSTHVSTTRQWLLGGEQKTCKHHIHTVSKAAIMRHDAHNNN